MKKLAALFGLLFLPIVLAQGFPSWVSQLYGVIFILVFIFILLAIGGVLKMPRAGGSWLALLVFLIIVIIFFLLPQYVKYPAYLEVPANFKIYPLPSFASATLRMLGLPAEWMYIPAMIYLFILPFAGIYTVVWAFLQSLDLFTGMKNVHRVLAFIITFITLPMGWFVKMVWILFGLMGGWAIAVFAAMFILGAVFRGATVARKEAVLFKSVKAPLAEAEKFSRQAQLLLKRHEAELKPEQIETIKSQISAYEVQIGKGLLTLKGGIEAIKRAIEEARSLAKKK